MEEAIREKTEEIKLALGELGRRLETGDDTRILYWVIPAHLACAHRPLRHHPRYGGSGRNLSPDAAPLVTEWARRVRAEGIRSIICLMHAKDLSYYAELDLGAENLLEFYAKQGFRVVSLPWEDPHHSRTATHDRQRKLCRIRTDALASYDGLPKPVLIQCSAAIDRSSPVAAYIYVHRRPAA